VLVHWFCVCLQSVLEFQQEKQARLNQLPAVVSLRLHQVEYLEARRLPQDLGGALVFSQQQLAGLKQRMQVRVELDCAGRDSLGPACSICSGF
jgi:hypothetical protein